MAKPNYQFEKRQRELKKIKQQEEKRLKKLAGGNSGDAPGVDEIPAVEAETTNPTEKTP